MASASGGSGVRREKRDISVAGAFWFGVGIFASVIVSILAMWWTFNYFTAREERAQTAPPSLVRGEGALLPPEPRLQMNPTVELREMRKEDARRLASYGWVDREEGIAHLPIERAMDLILEEGLPAREGTGEGAEEEEGSP